MPKTLKRTEALDEFEADLGGLIEAAASYIDEEVGPERAAATDYYQGEPFGDEIEGRSKFVSRDVRDTVHAMLPSILRVFFGNKHPLVFSPTSGANVEIAKQATDTVRHIVTQDNKGFEVVYAGCKDALIRRTGILTWYYDTAVDVKFSIRENLSEADLMVLMDEPDLDVEVIARRPETAPEEDVAPVDPQTGEPLPPPMLYDVRLRREAPRNKFVLAAIPPEEFKIDRRASCVDTADICGWERMLPEHELLAMGIDPELIEENLGDDELQDNEERIARDEDASTDLGELEPKALYGEFYVRRDLDGDGYPELLKVCVLGKGRKIVYYEYADERPFAVLSPDPEPHRWIGASVADAVMDIQRLKSYIIRSMIDSLAQAIQPRMGVVDSQVNIDDLLNNEVGGFIRMRQPGMVQPLDTPFVGQQALPVLAYMDEVKENRTGISKAAAGLDADALQSTTRAAVAATVTASQQQIEMIVRLLASGLSAAYAGLYRLFKKHQDRPRVIQLRGKFVEVDPRHWPTEMAVVVSVGIGDADDEKKLAVLGGLAAKQEQILATLGPANPLVGLAEYRATLAEMIELGGFPDAGRFIKEVDPNWQPSPAEPQPDPQVMAVQLEAQKAQAAHALEIEKAKAEDDRERDKNDRDFFLRWKELELKYGAQLDIAEINAAVQRERNAQPAAQPQGPTP